MHWARRHKAVTIALLIGVAGACSTLADNGGGDVALPNAAAGPFRPTEAGELVESRVAPYALRDDERFFRAPSVLDEDGAPSTPAALILTAMNTPIDGVDPDPALMPDSLVQFRAADGRSPVRQFDILLTVEAAWEGSWIDAPSALRHDGRVFLYYGAEGGLGLATGNGLSFTRTSADAPLLGPTDTPSGGTPRNPGAVKLSDGSFRLFYAVDDGGTSVLVEARSVDGVTFEDHQVVLRPREGEAALDDPQPVTAVSSQGRRLTYLYFATTTTEGRRRIDMAARFDGETTFQRAEGPVYDPGSDAPRAPFVVRKDAYSLLFVTQASGTGSDYPAVAVAVAPAIVSLLPAGN